MSNRGKITLTFELDDLQLILDALGELPAKQSFGLIQGIHNAVNQSVAMNIDKEENPKQEEPSTPKKNKGKDNEGKKHSIN